MADPELRSDEKVLLRTQGVYVKSIPFEGILTNKRIILVDRAKNLLPPKEIPLVTIKEAEPGENAIRDQIITLSVMAKTGETRQMILTFSRQAGGNRIKERDAWARIIKENASPTGSQGIRKVIPEQEPVIRRSEPAARPRYEVVHTPARPANPPREIPVRRQDSPLPSVPTPAASASAGTTMFCSKCGSRVPAESVFCNRCGSPVAGIPQAPAPVPAPAVRAEPAPAPVQVPPAPPVQEPATVQVPPAPVVVKTPSSRPIDEEIRSIEPLIERSTENIPNDALSAEQVKNPFEEHLAWDEKEVEQAGPIAEKPVEREPVQPTPLPKPVSETVPSMASSYGSSGDTPPPPKPPRGGNFIPGKNTLVTGAVALVAILIVAAGAFFVLPMLSDGNTDAGAVTTTPVPTTSGSTTPSTTATIREKQALVIPQTGVQVHVNYLGGFKGSYGVTGMLTAVPGNSGERVWEVENVNGTVQATFEKLDGSSHELVVEIYKDGKVLTSGTTTVGHGSVALSVDTITGIAAPPVSSGSASKTPAAAAGTTTRAVTTTVATTASTTTAAP